jgi:hypothetical protein
MSPITYSRPSLPSMWQKKLKHLDSQPFRNLFLLKKISRLVCFEVGNWGLVDWELGIGDWEIGIFSYFEIFVETKLVSLFKAKHDVQSS